MEKIFPFVRTLPIIISTCGFFVAFYIFSKKRKNEKLICPLDTNCDAVVHSKYSTFLGIPIEIIGMSYFALSALYFTSSIFILELNSTYLLFIMPAITLAAFLFSMYLLLVQLVLIKEWCTWCLISTILCTMQFITILMISPLNIREFFSAFFN